FDGEVGLAYASFGIMADKSLAARARKYALGYQRWRSTSPYPRLVKEVFDLQDTNGTPELARFVPDPGRLETCDWPAYLASTRRRLQEHMSATTAGTLLTASVDQDGPPVMLSPHAFPIETNDGGSFAMALAKRLGKRDKLGLGAGYALIVFDI